MMHTRSYYEERLHNILNCNDSGRIERTHFTFPTEADYPIRFGAYTLVQGIDQHLAYVRESIKHIEKHKKEVKAELACQEAALHQVELIIENTNPRIWYELSDKPCRSSYTFKKGYDALEKFYQRKLKLSKEAALSVVKSSRDTLNTLNVQELCYKVVLDYLEDYQSSAKTIKEFTI